MICSVYFGCLSEKRKIKWDNGETNPYEVLDTPICLTRKGHEILYEAAQYFSDKIAVDWGSLAWKCTPKEMVRFLCEHKTTLPWLLEDEEKRIEQVKTYIEKNNYNEFGVVFIEEL